MSTTISEMVTQIKDMGGENLQTGWDAGFGAYAATCSYDSVPCQGRGLTLENALQNLVNSMMVIIHAHPAG